MADPFQAFNVRLPEDLHRAVIERAEAEDRSLSALIRVALRHYLASTKPVAAARSTEEER